MHTTHEFHERFTDIGKAASYVGSGLICHSGKDVIEVIYESNARVRRWEGKPSEAGHAIEVFGRKFPRATVYYHDENPEGFLAEIHCHCDTGTKGECCDRKDNRPRIIVLLKKPADTDQTKHVDTIMHHSD